MTMTTPTTPEQARGLAADLAEFFGMNAEITALCSLADQVEALTAELNSVGLPKLAMCPACTEEVPMLQCDQLTQDAKRYRWLVTWKKTSGWQPDAIDREIAIDAAIAKGTA